MSWTKRLIENLQEGTPEDEARALVKAQREAAEWQANVEQIDEDILCICGEYKKDPDDMYCLSCQEEQAEEFRAHREREERDTH